MRPSENLPIIEKLVIFAVMLCALFFMYWVIDIIYSFKEWYAQLLLYEHGHLLVHEESEEWDLENVI